MFIDTQAKMITGFNITKINYKKGSSAYKTKH